MAVAPAGRGTLAAGCEDGACRLFDISGARAVCTCLCLLVSVGLLVCVYMCASLCVCVYDVCVGVHMCVTRAHRHADGGLVFARALHVSGGSEGRVLSVAWMSAGEPRVCARVGVRALGER